MVISAMAAYVPPLSPLSSPEPAAVEELFAGSAVAGSGDDVEVLKSAGFCRRHSASVTRPRPATAFRSRWVSAMALVTGPNPASWLSSLSRANATKRWVGVRVGPRVGLGPVGTVVPGALVGSGLGRRVDGLRVGAAVGPSEGARVGSGVGVAVGLWVNLRAGCPVGAAVGGVGAAVTGDADGRPVREMQASKVPHLPVRPVRAQMNGP